MKKYVRYADPETGRDEVSEGAGGEAAHILVHLAELRKRVIFSILCVVACSAAAFAFYDPLVALVSGPFSRLQLSSDLPARLFVHSVTEGFLVRVRISLLSGVIFALPAVFYHILRFVFPGLTGSERRTTGAAVIGGFVLAVGAFYYSYTQILPISLDFLTGSGFVPEDVGVLLNFRMSISFVLQILLIAVVLFQLPVVLLVLLKLELINARGALRAGPYVVVILLAVSAILTPPDVISQIGLALPLAALYFLAIGVAVLFRVGGR